MPDIDYQKLLEELKNAVIVPVKDRAKDFLAQNKDARDFLEDRAKRLAELGVELVKAGSDQDAVDAVMTQIKVVRQSIQNELAQVAVSASIESRNLFSQIIGTAFDVLVKAIPVVASVL